MLAGAALAPSAFLAASTGWFGHLGRWFPWVHHNDHRDLTSQAFDYLLGEGAVAAGSDLARNREAVEEACGMLDIMEGQTGGKVPGKLQWEYSHFYDPLRARGMDDRCYVNALDEYVDLWDRCLVHMNIDNLSKSYRFLGFCCHLLQDMAVPAHTFCIAHGLKTRTADNLELRSRARRFHLREPAGPPYPGDRATHVGLFLACGRESRGLEAYDDVPNDIAGILSRYYLEPKWGRDGWRGRYLGEPYYPYHRLLPSTPRIRLADLLALRNYLMGIASERTAQLLLHFARLTGAGD